MEEFEERGFWWSAADQFDQGDRVPGIIRFDNANGIELELMGSLRSNEAEAGIFDLPAYPILWGILTNNRCVTLLNCRIASVVRNPISRNQGTTEVFRCPFALVGFYWLTNADEGFREIAVSYNYLLHFIQQTGLSESLIDKNSKFDTYTLSYSPKTVELGEARGINYQLSLEASLKTALWKRTIDEKGFIRASTTAGGTYSLPEWLNNIVTPLNNLISLGLDVPLQVERLRLWTTADTSEQGKDDFTLALEVYYAQPSSKELAANERRIHVNYLFTLKDLQDLGHNFLDSWLQINEDYQVVCNLFFGSRIREAPYLESRFLVLSQAAEIFHRTRFGGTAETQQVYSQKLSAILAVIPKEYKKWLKEKLAWANELTLKQRLEVLFEHCEPIPTLLAIDRAAVIKRIKDTRNYYTHYGPALRSKAASGAELFWLTQTLRYLLSACLLIELGFSRDQIANLFTQNNNSFNNMRRELPNVEKEW